MFRVFFDSLYLYYYSLCNRLVEFVCLLYCSVTPNNFKRHLYPFSILFTASLWGVYFPLSISLLILTISASTSGLTVFSNLLLIDSLMNSDRLAYLPFFTSLSIREIRFFVTRTLIVSILHVYCIRGIYIFLWFMINASRSILGFEFCHFNPHCLRHYTFFLLILIILFQSVERH